MTNIDDYMELLFAEGYRPTKDDDGTYIYFKAEGKRYGLQLFEGDTSYIRLTSYWDFDDETSNEIAFRAANEVNQLFKVAKASVDPEDRDVLFSWEALYEEAAHAAPFVGRALHQLGSCASTFFERVKALQAAGEGSGALEEAG
jgi:hypothetical protein